MGDMNTDNPPMAIANLSDTYKPSLILSLLGLPHQRVGNLIGENAGTVRTHISRARQHLCPNVTGDWDAVIARLCEMGEIEVRIVQPADMIRVSAGAPTGERHWRTWFGEQQLAGKIGLAFNNLALQAQVTNMVRRYKDREPGLERAHAQLVFTREQAKDSMEAAAGRIEML